MKLTTFTKLTVAAAVFVCALPQDAFAQAYSYNYGGGRINRMHSSTGGSGMWSGLHNHESTYIPTGSCNESAKGKATGGVGKLSNPLLPSVSWGRTVGTSGDNFYMDGGHPDTPDAALPSYMLPKKQRAISAQQQQQMMMIQRRKQEEARLGIPYTPGQNARSQSTYTQNGSGAFTYE